MIKNNIQMVKCDEPNCPEYVLFQGPRKGKGLIEVELVNIHGWGVEQVDGESRLLHFCTKHKDEANRTVAKKKVVVEPPPRKVFDCRERGKGY